MQQEYGVPAIGDLFQARDVDIKQTLDSTYDMMKRHGNYMDKFTDTRKRYQAMEQEKSNVQDEL
jgi:hypothetical protein